MKYALFTFLFVGALGTGVYAQPLSGSNATTRADSVRGTYGPYRTWWDVQQYNLAVKPDAETRSISGRNFITFKVLAADQPKLQLDLQPPMQLDSALYKGQKLSFERYEKAYLITFTSLPAVGEEGVLEAYFHGIPKVAAYPPWDGGLIWTQDDKGNPWISVACQGLGASVWWPVKDHGADEPDRGVILTVTVPHGMVDVSNGIQVLDLPLGTGTVYAWEVKAPINSYNITMNVGKYTHFSDTYNGAKGPLNLQFWFLEQHEAMAKKHLLEQTKTMLRSFEYWFGPYPFYEDGYKLIETPFLGMEHQSGIAYGNGFMMGYKGTDRSGSGWGLKWDYILVHESGHEWFGNNISTKDVADMWVHEGFTTYSEVLFVESEFGKKAANAYVIGLRGNIANDKPIIGPYGVNREGSTDMYDKGAQMIHTYRQILDDDVKFRELLHEMNRRFARITITTQDVEALMQEYVPQVNLQPFFDTYLRTVKIPVLKKQWTENGLRVRFAETAKGFAMPITITVARKPYHLTVSDQWTETGVPSTDKDPVLTVDPNYYVKVE